MQLLTSAADCALGQIKWWHNQGIVLGIAIAVGGTLLILLEWAISFRRKRDANDWISLGAIGCLFVLLVVSIVDLHRCLLPT